MTQPAQIAGRAVDLSNPDVVFLASRIVDLERELDHARQYLETCRRLVDAGEDEMLLDALRRRLHQSEDRLATDAGPSRRRHGQL